MISTVLVTGASKGIGRAIALKLAAEGLKAKQIASALGIGQQTPPVASVLMTACSIAKADMWKVTRVNLPFIGLLVVLLLMVTYIPAIPMFLVEYFYR